MASIDDKKGFILEQEHRLASRMALEVINRPTLNIWMILIPVVFVYYFYGLHRFSTGKKEFTKHFVDTRRLILNEACSALESGKKIDFRELARHEQVPEDAVKAYVDWAKVLSDHYVKLLNTKGSDFKSLVQARYGELGSYLLILDQINKAESRFYKALRKDLKHSVSDAGEVIKKMEKSLGHLRRDEARAAFSMS